VVATALLTNSDRPELLAAIRAYRALKLPEVAAVAPRERRSLPKRAKWLNDAEKVRLAAAYRRGATVYELADQFGIDRRTVALQLKRVGVTMRRQPPTGEQVDEMVRLYESGQSLKKVGRQLHFNDMTVARYLRERGARIRGAHERS
jgi:DNA-binding CsgD family transcriptional regulator